MDQDSFLWANHLTFSFDIQNPYRSKWPEVHHISWNKRHPNIQQKHLKVRIPSWRTPWRARRRDRGMPWWQPWKPLTFTGNECGLRCPCALPVDSSRAVAPASQPESLAKPLPGRHRCTTTTTETRPALEHFYHSNWSTAALDLKNTSQECCWKKHLEPRWICKN